MILQLVGCSHHQTPVEVRERIAFNSDQAGEALARFRVRFPRSEAVLLSTCNRVEFYAACETADQCPSPHEMIKFLADYHGFDAVEIFEELFERTGEDAVRHLFTVAASLDSMVVGEAQILSQVKQAYQLASEKNSAGPLTHLAFQAAIRVAKRVASETAIQQKRVSIPSVAVKDYAAEAFERFDDKLVLVIGAGEMGEETVRYLQDEGARQITIVNRTLARAEELAVRLAGRAEPWERLEELLAKADLVVSATGAEEPIMNLSQYKVIEGRRNQQLLFILDLAVPRDFDPAIGDRLGVYLLSVDDLKGVCEKNRREREKEWPKAQRVIESETSRFMADLHHRATAPTIRRLRERAEELRNEEVRRLLNKLGDLSPVDQKEIERSFERLVNKLLHPPLDSLRSESETGSPHGLLDALKRLFQLKD